MKSNIIQQAALTCRCFIIVCIAWSSASGQTASLDHSSKSHVMREVETKIEMVPSSKKISVIITNHAKEPRYLLMPLDLMSYRIKLSTSEGKELEMTSKGRKELVDPYPIGSIRLTTLKTDVPWSEIINLEHLFQFPEQGEVRCEMSRHILFTHPNDKPRDAEWISFPPIMLPSGKPAPEPANHPGPSSPQAKQSSELLSINPSATKPKAPAPTTTVTPTSMETTGSTPWSVVAVLIVAAMGLLWLLVKKRK